MNHAPGAVTPLDPEMVQVGDSVGQRAERRGLFQGAVWPMGVVEVLVLAQHDHQVLRPPRHTGGAWHEEFPREVIIAAERDSAAAGTVRYAALRDGVIAGGATMRIAEGVAQLTGAATAPAHRRRGVQSALLSARLADAAAADCDVAVITTQPGSKSHQNAQRQGFDLLYARAVLVKQP
jgi:ribosomal protein S18 acetylase RimI-like enzyme